MNTADPVSTAAAMRLGVSWPSGRPVVGESDDGKRDHRAQQRGKGKILVARIEHQPERHMDGGDHGRGEERRQHHFDTIGLRQ